MNLFQAIITEEPVVSQEARSPIGSPGRRFGLRLALLSGLLLWLANPPAALWPLAWVAIVPFILSVQRAATGWQAAWRGYLFGWAFLGPTWYWIGLTISGWTGSAIGWVAWFGLTLILASFYALWGGVAWCLSQRLRGGALVVALAAAWVVMEWGRTLGELGMPWAQLSYTQVAFLPILQVAELTGAYGVSFAILLVNAAVAGFWARRGEPDARRPLLGSLILAGLLALYGGIRLATPEVGTPLTVAALQGNFPMRASEEVNALALKRFTDLSARAAEHQPPPTLHVWSESAAPDDALHNLSTRAFLEGLAQQYGVGLLVGSRVVDAQTGEEANSALLFSPEGGPPQRYDKRQLVPFGEYIPFRAWFPAAVAKAFDFFPTDLIRGPGPAVMGYTDRVAGTVALGPYICYEAMYPQYARGATAAGAQLLVTISNDGWFHSRAAMEQHLAAVALRTIENRRATVRATMTGITCLLDSRGRVTARATIEQPDFVVGTVRLQSGRTLYTRFGDWFALVCGLLAMGLVWGTARRRERR